MKALRKITAIVLVFVCVVILTSNVALASARIAQNNVTWDGSDVKVQITMNANRIVYNSGWENSGEHGFITLRFRGDNNNFVGTYSFDVPLYRNEGLIKCNIPAGTYTITKIGGTPGRICSRIRVLILVLFILNIMEK